LYEHDESGDHGEVRIGHTRAYTEYIISRTANGHHFTARRDDLIETNMGQFAAHVAINVGLGKSKSRLCEAIDPQHGSSTERGSTFTSLHSHHHVLDLDASISSSNNI